MTATTSTKEEIERIGRRMELVVATFEDFQSSVAALTEQGAEEELVEEAREKAIIYYETYLDMIIMQSKLLRKLTLPNGN